MAAGMVAQHLRKSFEMSSGEKIWETVSSSRVARIEGFVFVPKLTMTRRKWMRFAMKIERAR
jgi:hypothetical protein